MNKKGFTLIELLAVIIILGILMIIAIPSVTKYINDSRKSSYIDTAKEITSGARNLVNEGKLEMYDTNTTYYIPSNCIKTENGGNAVSPYGDFVKDKTYVVVTYDGKGYDYYWVSLDETGQGIPELKSVDELDIDDIKSDLTRDDIRDDIGVGNRDKVTIFNETCTGKIDKDAYVDEMYAIVLNDKESQLRKIDDDVYIFKGGNPDNYVKFNCDNNNCETWRIIGIYGNQIKIQNTVAQPSQRYKDTNSGDNDWTNSIIEKYLNSEVEGGYYYGLNQSAKDLISTGIWNCGPTTHEAIASEAYTSAKLTTIERKVGLAATYEYLYATATDSCLNNTGFYYNINNCARNGYDWMVPASGMWTISPLIGYNGYMLVIYGSGVVNKTEKINNNAFYPTVFLNSSVKITGGTGTSSDPYTLGL